MSSTFFRLGHIIFVVVLVATAAAVSAAAASLPTSWGNAFPLSFRRCDKRSSITGWNFDADGGMSMESDRQSVWETYGGPNENNHVTLWERVPDPIPGNFRYAWTATELPGITNLGQLKQNGWCVGFEHDELYQPVVLKDCSDAAHTVLRRTELSTAAAGGADTSASYTLRTPAGLCVAVPLPYQTSRGVTATHDLEAAFGINGFSPRNLTFLSKFSLRLPAFKGQPWSKNLLLWPASSAGDETMSTTSISAVSEKGARKWFVATGGSASSKSSNSSVVVVDDIVLRNSNAAAADDSDIAATEQWTMRSWVEKASSSDSGDAESGGENETSWAWRVKRTYAADVEEVASRFATLLWAPAGNGAGPGSAPQKQAPLAATIDPTFQRNRSSGSAFNFWTGKGGALQKGEMQEYLYAYSQRSQGRFSLQPLDLCFRWKLRARGNTTPVSFTMQWPNPAPTGQAGFGLMSHGSGGGSGGATKILKGTVVDVELILTVASDPAECTFPLDVKADSKELPFSAAAAAAGANSNDLHNRTQNLVALARTFTLWAGNWFGNSPSSTQCIFELGLLMKANAILTPKTRAAADEQLATMRAHFQFLFDSGIVLLPSGIVQSQLCQQGWCPYPAMYQAQSQFLLAVADFAEFSGDKRFILKNFNASILPALKFLLDDNGMQMRKNFGIALCTGASPLASGVSLAGLNASQRAARDPQSADWLDIRIGGGADSIIVAEALQAVRRFADLVRWIGEDGTFLGEGCPTEEELLAVHERGVETFNRLFWCDGAVQDGGQMFADWVPITSFPILENTTHLKDKRCYSYVWQNFLAVDPSGGILAKNRSRAQAILNSIDRGYERINSAYGESRHLNASSGGGGLWCTPTNFRYLPFSEQIAWKQGSPYINPHNNKSDENVPSGVYEAGACFMLTSGQELAMRLSAAENLTAAPTSSPRAAVSLLDRVLGKFGEFRLYGQHYQWASTSLREQGFTGADILTDTAFVAVGFTELFGLGGRRTVLNKTPSSGGRIVGTAFSGWQWRFIHLGERFLAYVNASGVVVVTEDPWPAPAASSSHSNEAGIIVGIIFSLFAALFLVLIVWYGLKKQQQDVGTARNATRVGSAAAAAAEIEGSNATTSTQYSPLQVA